MSGFDYTEITRDNLDEFKLWLRESPSNVDLNVAEDVALKDLFAEGYEAGKDRDTMSDAIFRNILNRSANAGRVTEVVALIEENGEAGRVFHGRGVSKAVEEYLRDRPIEQNLAFLDHSNAHISDADFGRYEPGQLRELSGEQRKHLVSIFERAKNAPERRPNEEAIVAKEFVRGRMTAAFMNCQNLPASIRQEINRDLVHKPQLYPYLDNQFFTEDLVKSVLKNAQDKKIQTEKNVNANSELIKYQDVILAVVEKKSMENGKTLHETFREMCIDTFGKPQLGGLSNYFYNREPIASLYMETARRDICNGRANQLPDDVLTSVLYKDKEGVYGDKIPADVKERLSSGSIPLKKVLDGTEDKKKEIREHVGQLKKALRQKPESKTKNLVKKQERGSTVSAAQIAEIKKRKELQK